jgi:hypothetical protein
MHVGNTSRERKIYLRSIIDWARVEIVEDILITPTDIFEAYCVFSYLGGLLRFQLSRRTFP